jgi:tungstate transport system ATP-binding protein
MRPCFLAGVDLTIARGACTLVLGANGAGKSTLLAPAAWIAGSERRNDCMGWRSAAAAGQAMVFQRAVLLRRSAAANIRYALKLCEGKRTEADARIDDALAEVGLPHLGHRSARTLSGGEQQRLALARAWALRPEVLFLDEPTASLDPRATRAVEDIVRGIHARGTTIVMSTHNLAQARRLADDIVFLHEGRLTEQSPASIFFHRRELRRQRLSRGERL